MLLVQGIKTYRQKDGVDILKVFLKPTKNFPEGRNYFYTDAIAEDLVNQYCWYLENSGIKNPKVYVMSHGTGDANANRILFHRELYKIYSGVDAGDLIIDHMSMVEFDNTDNNLTPVGYQQNMYNRFLKGYQITDNRKYGTDLYFIPTIGIGAKNYRPFGCKHTKEDEACILQRKLETEWLQEQLGSDVYRFDLLEYRRGSLDILDLERTGQISHEEATYRHILKYADNAWYYLRYNLEDFFKEHHIPVPEYSLDDEGYMIDKITGKKLCPFYK